MNGLSVISVFDTYFYDFGFAAVNDGLRMSSVVRDYQFGIAERTCFGLTKAKL